MTIPDRFGQLLVTAIVVFSLLEFVSHFSDKTLRSLVLTADGQLFSVLFRLQGPLQQGVFIKVVTMHCLDELCMLCGYR